MRRLVALCLLSVLCASSALADVVIDEENFPDEAFRAYVLSADVSIDKNQDGYLSEEEIAGVTSIEVAGAEWQRGSISSLAGIEHFTALESLSCAYNHLTALDVSKNTELTYLNCSGNSEYSYDIGGYVGGIATLDVSKNTALEHLYCGYNQLTALDVSKNTALEHLYCGYNQLTALDVSNNTALKHLYCGYNQLTALDVSKCIRLTELNCYDNQLPVLNVSKNTALTGLYCGNNQLTALDVSKNTALTHLDCQGNQLPTLNVSNNVLLVTLDCYYNCIQSLDLTHNSALTRLECRDNCLVGLDISNNVALEDLSCGNYTHTYPSNNHLEKLDISKNTKLEILDCTGLKLTTLDVSNNTALTYLFCSDNQLTDLDVSNNTSLTMLDCSDNQLTTLDIRNCPSLTPDSVTRDSTVLLIHGNTSSLPSFDKHSLVLSGQIGVDYYLSLPSGANTTGSYLTFTVSGDKHNPVPFSDGVSMDDGKYRFTCYITSVQMADEIEAFYVYSQDNYSLALANTYTAKDYLDTVISNAPETSTDLIALAKAIKDYGHYVQPPCADNNGWEIGVKHAEMDCANENIDSDSSEVTAKLADYATSWDKSAGLSAGIITVKRSLELD